MQIIQHGEHTDKISLQQIWGALQFINSLSFPYYDLEIGKAQVDELGGERRKQLEKHTLRVGKGGKKNGE